MSVKIRARLRLKAINRCYEFADGLADGVMQGDKHSLRMFEFALEELIKTGKGEVATHERYLEVVRKALSLKGLPEELGLTKKEISALIFLVYHM